MVRLEERAEDVVLAELSTETAMAGIGHNSCFDRFLGRLSSAYFVAHVA